MANDNAAMMYGLLPIVAMNKAEASRAKNAPLVLVPGSPSTRAVLGSFAVTNQARESLRREKRVAEAVLGVVEGVVAGQAPAAAIAGQSALKDLAPDQLAGRLTSIFPPPSEEGEGTESGETAPEQVEARIEAAVQKAVEETKVEAKRILDLATAMVIAAIGKDKDDLFTATQAKPFSDYLTQVSAEDQAKIVK